MAAIVEAEVGPLVASYDEVDGPRMTTRLLHARVRAGSLGGVSADDLAVHTFGGLLPDGKRFLHAVHITRLLPGTRVLLFLANGDWFDSPVVHGLGFRVVSAADGDRVVDDDGRAITGFGVGGVSAGAQIAAAQGRGKPGDTTPVNPTPEELAAGLTVDQLVEAAVHTADGLGIQLGGEFRPTPTPRGLRWDAPTAVPYDGPLGEVAP